MNIFKKLKDIYKVEGLSGIFTRSVSEALRRSTVSIDSLAYRIECSDHTRRGIASKFLSRNEIFRNRHKGQRCFVIGNGPSLKSQNLSHLANEITYVMSGFYKHPVVKQWQPNYYCLADPLFSDGSEQMKKFFNDLLSNIHSTTFLLPIQGHDTFLCNYSLTLECTFFVQLKGNLGKGISGLPDFTKVVPGVQSVSQMAIMAAMYMGCSPIYLLGVDHDWLAQRGMDRHFYEGKTIAGHPIAHGNLNLFSYKSDLVSVLNLWNGYENLANIAQQYNIQIINATNGGFLDVFPRADYKSLFDTHENKML